MKTLTVISALFVALAGLAAPLTARAETAAEFYEGNTIRWVIPYRPGGGFDEFSRLIAPFLEKYTGASVELVNMPGTGGLKGASEVYRAPSDGLHVGLLNGGALVGLAIAGEDSPHFDLRDYSYVGRVSAEETVFILSSASDISNLDEIMNGDAPLIVGSTGGGGSSYVDAKVPGEIFEFNQKIVSGFDSSSDVRLALLRGDIDGSWGSYSTQMKAVNNDVGVPILRTGRAPAVGLEDVPSVFDFTENLDDSQIDLLDAWDALASTGRILMAPPDVPDDRVAFLGDALRQSLDDEELQAMLEAAKRPASYLSGEETRDVVLRTLDADSETIEVIRSAMAGK